MRHAVPHRPSAKEIPLPRASTRRVALAATLAATLTGLTAAFAPAHTAAPAPARAAARPGAPAASGAPGAAGLLLLNGDRALVSPRATAGGLGAGIRRAPGAHGLAGAVLALRAGTNTFLLPAAAMPFLGRGLDPSLFELSALSRAERDGRLPVTVRYQGAPHALPGITVTSRGTGAARGYLTASSARVFGAALARQMLADHASDSYGQDGLFAGGTSIGLAGVPPAAPAAPASPVHTLTMRGINLAGQPDTGDEVDVYNVTDLAKFGDPIESTSAFYHGSARFSVPSGTYWSFALFFGPGGATRMDILPQFTVHGDTTRTLSAGAATSEQAFVTPRPAVDTGATSFTLVRGSTTGGSVTSFFFGFSPLWVSPVTRPPTAGFLYSVTSTQLVSPPGPGTPYAYGLDFPAPPGTVAPQHFVARPGGLATVAERFYQDAPATGGWLSTGATAQQLQTSGFAGASTPLPLPGRQTLYLSAATPTFWQTSYFLGNAPGGQTDGWRLLHARQHLAESWNACPLHPGPNVSLPGTAAVQPVLPSASRAGSKLLVDITPFSDNTFGHTGAGFSVLSGPPGGSTGSYAIYQDGTRIAGGKAPPSFLGDLFAQAQLSPHPARIRFVLTASRQGPAPDLSATSQDVWTWPSRPDPAATVPPPWYCGGSVVHGQVVFDRHCAVQDMMTLRYRLAGQSLAGATRPGRQVLGITVGHLQEEARFPVTGAAALVSFDGGVSWSPVTIVHTGAGQFRASYTAPAGATVSLRVTASDTRGASVTETILGAYRVSG